jgi:thiamine-phosphate pyrophosphorylase
VIAASADRGLPTVLPRVLVLTDRAQTGGRPLAAVVRGAEAVVLREKDLARDARARLAAELRPLVDLLLIASDPTIEGDGVHLASDDPFPAPRPRVVGRSCHSRADLERAAAEGCDYATLSPIFESPSKPGYGPALGVEALRDAPLPVYALGGVDDTNAAACLDAGAVGVAMMGAAMHHPNLRNAVRHDVLSDASSPRRRR